MKEVGRIRISRKETEFRERISKYNERNILFEH